MRNSTITTHTPARWVLKIPVDIPNSSGPTNAVAFPEKAKKPKNSFSLSAGENRPSSERLAAWFGPTSSPMPIPAIIFIALAVAAYIVLYHTAFGRAVYAVGGNPISAWLSGINTKNVLFMAYIISGVCAGIAGVILTSRMMVGALGVAGGLELDSIAAVCIGGVSLAGGKGSLIGVVLGVFIISIIKCNF